MLVAVLFVACGADGSGARVHEYRIPAGAYARTEAGEDLGIIPPEIEVQVGDRIRIVNDDTTGQTIGPYYVGPESTVEHTFREPGVFEGLCTAHPERSIRIVVTEPPS